MSLKILFIVGLVGATYSYFLYPALLLILIKIKKQKSIQTSQMSAIEYPDISFIITAYNEEKHLAKKIENTLSVDYPADKLEIIIASDGSTDKTANIAQSFSDKGVIFHQVLERKGKENAQRSAINIAKGEILVFSDVSTQIERCSLNVIADRFKNPKIGALSSEDRFITENGEIAGEGAYVKYEMWLRKLESNVSGLVGLSGSFFAARKVICEDWDISVPSDFNTALNCINMNYRTISAPDLLGFYPDIKSGGKEFERKVRTVIRGIATLFNKSEVLNPFKFGFFSFQIISHKLMRWLVPWFLLITLVANYALMDNHPFFKLFMAGQILFYSAALIGYRIKSTRKSSIIKLCFFFVQVNIAILQATLLYITGKRITKWEPSKR